MASATKKTTQTETVELTAPPQLRPSHVSHLSIDEQDAFQRELAYRCAANGGRHVTGFADSMGLSRDEFVDLVSDPQFEVYLARYTRAVLELPFHRALHKKRIEEGLLGESRFLEITTAPRELPTLKLQREVEEVESLQGPMEGLLEAFTASLGASRSIFASPQDSEEPDLPSPSPGSPDA